MVKKMATTDKVGLNKIHDSEQKAKEKKVDIANLAMITLDDYSPRYVLPMEEALAMFKMMATATLVTREYDSDASVYNFHVASGRTRERCAPKLEAFSAGDWGLAHLLRKQEEES